MKDNLKPLTGEELQISGGEPITLAAIGITMAAAACITIVKVVIDDWDNFKAGLSGKAEK